MHNLQNSDAAEFNGREGTLVSFSTAGVGKKGRWIVQLRGKKLSAEPKNLMVVETGK